MQLSLFGLLLLTQPLNSSEQDKRANLEFSSNFLTITSYEEINYVLVLFEELNSSINSSDSSDSSSDSSGDESSPSSGSSSSSSQSSDSNSDSEATIQ